jgi:hypothetical protein
MVMRAKVHLSIMRTPDKQWQISSEIAIKVD